MHNPAIYGASWVHKKSGYPELGDLSLAQQVAEAGRRILAKPLNCKKALEVSQVKVISRLGQGNLGEIQVAALFALGFFKLLCWDDLSRLTVDNLQFADAHLAMFLRQRKNDKFNNGSWVFIAQSNISPCLVAVTKKFIKMGWYDSNSRLFHQILKTMSYSRANEVIKQELRKERLDPGFHGIYSLGAGDHWQQQPEVYLIGCSSGREDGVVTSPKITTSRSPLSRC